MEEAYWLTRILLLRFLAFIFGVAFLVAYNQNTQLLGDRGLTPASAYLNQLRRRLPGSSEFERFLYVPTLLWWSEDVQRDLHRMAVTGLIISAFVFISGRSNMLLQFALWIMYHSIVNVGQRCFAATVSHELRPSQTVVWGYRWLLFRIMIGAGLIKLRGDRCWRDLTCMNYFYETQPVPSAATWYFHALPLWYHNFEVAANHFVELVAPVLLLSPWRKPRIIGGLIQILFQLALIASGNLSFLNWLTILPALACFDDASLRWMFARSTVEETETAQRRHDTPNSPFGIKCANLQRMVVDISLFGLIAYLSIPVVKNLISSRQHMNTSFDSFRLVNTYGAFGSVTAKRDEVVIQGTHSSNPYHASADWLEFEFNCKPGDVTRRPCQITPYHYRLDWLMWFAGIYPPHHSDWIEDLMRRFKKNDSLALDLIAFSPFTGAKNPRWVRAVIYRYNFVRSWASRNWWARRFREVFIQPL